MENERMDAEFNCMFSPQAETKIPHLLRCLSMVV